MEPGSHRHGAVVGLRDAADDGQPEPCAWHASRGGGPVEAFEDVREILIGDARAVVGDRYLAVLDDHAHRGVGRRPFEGVVDQVADGVIDRGRVDMHQARMQFGVDGRAGRALAQAEKFGAELAVACGAVRFVCDGARGYEVTLSSGAAVRDGLAPAICPLILPSTRYISVREINVVHTSA